MGKQTASCGHEVIDGGISFALNSYTKHGKKCMDYKTYCAKCTFVLLLDNKLFNFKEERENTDIGLLKKYLDEK
jgi:hypothetical protein